MKSIAFWGPALVCGLISFIAMLGSVHGRSRWWQPIFFAFLPGCFLFLGAVMRKMNHEITRLRRRVSRLEQRQQEEPAGGPEESHSDSLTDAD